MIPTRPELRFNALSVVIAKDQPQYIPLPANIKGPYVETKWKLSFRERLTMLLTGDLYLIIKTFGKPLQPIKMSVLRSQDL